MRVATFNLKHGATADGYKANPELFKEACKQLQDLDILALQELDKGVLRSHRSDLAEIAAEVTGMTPVFRPTMKFTVGEYGNALLVRGEIEDEQIVPLGSRTRFNKKLGSVSLGIGREPRNAIVATAKVGGRRISIAATHLSTQASIKGEQLERVATSLNHRSGPRILLGDLNLTRDQAARHFASNSLEMSTSALTYPADNPNKQIDHIAVQGLTFYSVEARRLPVSDHLALIAEVE